MGTLKRSTITALERLIPYLYNGKIGCGSALSSFGNRSMFAPALSGNVLPRSRTVAILIKLNITLGSDNLNTCINLHY